MPRIKGRLFRPYVDYSGKRFAKLTVLWAAGWRPDGNGHRIVWTCQCDCGNITVAYTCDLRRGRTKSCGCGKIVTHNANAMLLFSQYRNKAKERGYEWALTFEQFVKLTSSNCHYTGWAPRQICLKSKNHEPYIWNGIDRVDNSKGYILDNCVPCDGVVNKAKRNTSKEDFLSMCKAITKTQETQTCQ